LVSLPILILPTSPHPSSSGAGKIGQRLTDVPSGFSLTLIKQTKIYPRHSRPLYLREKSHHHSLETWLDVPQSRSGRCRENTNLCLCWDSNRDFPIV
jgi:hypothetical protein